MATSSPARRTNAPAPAADPQQQIRQCFKSFSRFCGLLSIQPKEGGGRIPLVLSPIQRAYCKARTSRDIVLKPRQVHMTTCEAARDLWWFLTKPGARVVVVCQSQTDQAALKDISYKFTLFIDSLRRLGVEMKFGAESTSEWTLPATDSTLRIIQAGASESSAQKKGRGGTVNRLHISEAAFFEHADDTFNSLQESVPRFDSEVVNESTPNGAAGFYFEQWKAAIEGGGKSAYTPHFFPWWIHPDYRMPLEPGESLEPYDERELWRIEHGASPEAIKWRRWKVAEKGGNDLLVTQEYPDDPETCFLVAGRCFFDLVKLAVDMRSVREPIEIDEHGNLRIFAHPRDGYDYDIGGDTAEGTGGNPSAACVFERETGRHMATLHGQYIPHDFAAALARLGKRYNMARVAPERNNTGHAVLEALVHTERYRKIYKYLDGKLGYPTHDVTRGPMLDKLDADHRHSRFTTPDALFLGQMRTFCFNKLGKPEASKGAEDDVVMAGAIGWALINRPRGGTVLEEDPYGGEE